MNRFDGPVTDEGDQRADPRDELYLRIADIIETAVQRGIPEDDARLLAWASGVDFRPPRRARVNNDVPF